MNELTVTNGNLPANLEDLSALVVIDQEKLKAVNAQLRAMKRLGFAEEAVRLKTKEAQQLAEQKTYAEMMLGKLTAAMPTSQGKRNDITSAPTMQKLETKEEALKRVNIPHQHASQYERMAANPDIVEEALAEARENGDIVSRASILKKVKQKQKAEQRAAKMATIKEAAVTDGNLVHGDCLEELKKLADGSVDCVVTDPPYGINYVSNFRTVESEVVKSVANDTIEDAVMLWNNTCAILERKMKADSHLYCFTSWKVYPYFVNIISKYFKVKNCLIWEKNNWSMGDLDGNYAEQYEMVIFATKGNRKLNGGRDTNILHFDRVANSSLLHSCEKPVDLLSFLIEKSTDGGELVADPFMGSGSTMVAAKNVGRQYWGCELDEENYRIACGRCVDGNR